MIGKNVVSLRTRRKKTGMVRYEERPKHDKRIFVKLPEPKEGHDWCVSFENEKTETDEKTGERTFRLTFEWIELPENRITRIGGNEK